jgi:hypothetical protein
MRSTLASTLVLGALILSGCDASSDDLSLSLDPTTYPAYGDDEAPVMVGINIEGLGGGNIHLPACPVAAPVGKVPVLDRERLDGDTWVVQVQLGSCDPETASQTVILSEASRPHFLTSGPKAAGTYRWTLWVETPEGDRVAVHSTELTVTGG